MVWGLEMRTTQNLNPERWIDHVFSAKAVEKGGVIRRSVHWVDHEIGKDRFKAEVRGRGFSMIECAGQYVVICSRSPIRRIV